MAARRRSVVATALGVRPGEVDAVRSLAAAAFLLGLGLVLFYSAGNAIFLTRYDISALPWVYIVNAFVVIAVGLAYGAWSARVTTDRALVALAASLTASVAGLWLLVLVWDGRPVAFALAVWFRLLFIFAVLGLWEIASVVFDIRQAKRLFAPVALGMLLAFVVGGVLTGPVSGWIGSAHLVGIAAACFLAYTLALARLLHRHGVGGPRGVGVVVPAGPREIIAEPYSRQLVAMKTVTIVLLYVSEYVLYEQAATTFETEDAIAGFFGLFMGATTLVMVVVAGVVAGRFISRFGLLAGIGILPLGMLAVSVAGGVYGLAVGIDTVFFVLVGLLVVTDRVLGDAIGEPAGAVLFQPLPARQRMRVRLAVDGWLGSVALLGSGVLLLAFQALDLDSVAPYLFVVSVVAAAGVIVARRLYGGYVGAVRAATTIGVGTDTLPALLDGTERDAVLGALGAEDPGAVVATAGLLRSLEPEPLAPALPALVTHPDPDVVAAALDGLDRLAHPPWGTVEAVLGRRDLPPSTRARALGVLARHDPEAATAWADRERDGALGPAVLALDVSAGRTDAAAAWEALSRSSDEGDRRSAAATLAAVHDAAPGVAADVAARLLTDTDPAVVADALEAVTGRVGALGVSDAVLARSREPVHRWAAFRALLGNPELLLALADDQRDDELAAAALERCPPDPAPVAVALAWLNGPPVPSPRRRAAFGVLARDPDPERVGNGDADVGPDLALIEDLRIAHGTAGATAPAVAAALAEEFELARATVWTALARGHDPARVDDLATLVRVGDLDDRANAIEALEAMLAPSRRRPIVAALEPVGLDDAVGDRSAAPGDAATALSALAADRRLGAWTRRVCATQATILTTPSAKGAPTMPSDVARVLALKRIDIFATLPFSTLAELADLVTDVDVPAGTVIVAAGTVGGDLYAITSGEVEVRSAEGHVSRLGAGTVFGELAVLDPAPRSATVTAVAPVQLIVVPRTTLLALADRRPAVMTEIARVLARRLRER